MPSRYRSRRYRNRLVLLGLLALFTDGQPAHAISLQDAVARAVSNSPEVAASQQQQRILQQQIQQIAASYLPSIDLSTGFGNEQTRNAATRSTGQGTASLPRSEARLVINQVLFDGFGTFNEIRRLQAAYEAAHWGYQNTAQTVAMNAIHHYTNVQKHTELLRLIQRFSGIQADFLEKIKAWYEGGAGTIADVWQTESRLTLTRSSIATAKSQLDQATDAFTRLFGFHPHDLTPVPSVTPALPRSLAQAVAQATTLHPSVRESAFNVEAAAAKHDASRTGLWPSVSVALETNHITNANGVAGTTRAASAMVRLNYNLFRGGSDLARSSEARRRLEQIQTETEKKRRLLRENIEKSWHTIQELRTRLRHLEHHTTISKQVVDAYYEQFFADKRTLLNVLNAENELFTAQSNRVKGRYALLVEEYRFLANLGILQASLKTLSNPPVDSPPRNDPTPPDIAPVKRARPQQSNPTAVPLRRPPASTQIPPQNRASTTQGHTWIRNNGSIPLYLHPVPTSDVSKTVSDHTPLRLIGYHNGWLEVVDPAGRSLWMMGPIRPDGRPNPAWQAGIVTSTTVSP